MTPVVNLLHSAKLSRAVIVLVLLASTGCQQRTATLPPPGTTTPAAFSIYFTDPKKPTADSYRGGPDTDLAKAIEQARLSVDIAIYDLNLWSIRDALLKAYRRGVAVRVITESDNLDEAEIQDLKNAGIPVLGDRRGGLMHNKYVVIDRSEIWTGSMNFTTTDGYLNNNNLLRIRSSRLAEDYTVEFNEMFQDDLFGPDVRAATPYPEVTIDGIPVAVYFSPDDGAQAHLVELLNGAQRSIYFLAFSWTSDDLTNAVLERAQNGVVVAGVMEESQVQSNIGSDYDRFQQAGLDVRLDGNSRNMHHKVIIIDEKIVVTGSYNFTNSAEEFNDENVLVLHDPGLAAQFLIEFQQIYADGHR
jgi:phosphatidylserine/phosphatidylglycerophosphate/cardiolipin synthase-like enzyme